MPHALWGRCHPTLITCRGNIQTTTVSACKFTEIQLTVNQHRFWLVWSLKVGHIELVEQWDAATLLPIIPKVMARQTTIWSDEWTACWQLALLGYSHQTVNHSISRIRRQAPIPIILDTAAYKRTYLLTYLLTGVLWDVPRLPRRAYTYQVTYQVRPHLHWRQRRWGHQAKRTGGPWRSPSLSFWSCQGDSWRC